MALAVLYVLAAVWFLGNQIFAYRRAKSSTSWPSVNGVIEYAQREVFALDDYGNLTGVRIVYRYKVKDQTYKAKTIGFSPRFIASRKMLYTHRPGKKVRVYYAPQKPEVATLERGVTIGNYVMMLAALLLFGLTVTNLMLQTGVI